MKVETIYKPMNIADLRPGDFAILNYRDSRCLALTLQSGPHMAEAFALLEGHPVHELSNTPAVLNRNSFPQRVALHVPGAIVKLNADPDNIRFGMEDWPIPGSIFVDGDRYLLAAHFDSAQVLFFDVLTGERVDTHLPHSPWWSAWSVAVPDGLGAFTTIASIKASRRLKT